MQNANNDWLRLNQAFDEHGARALIFGGLALGVVCSVASLPVGQAPLGHPSAGTALLAPALFACASLLSGSILVATSALTGGKIGAATSPAAKAPEPTAATAS